MEQALVGLRQIESTNVREIRAAVAEDGACIALNVLPPALCDALVDDFQPHLDALEWGVDDLGYRNEFYGGQTKRLHGLFSRSSRMVEVLTHPLFLALAQQMFVESGLSRDIRLSNAELMVLNRDQGVQMFHTDGASWRRAQESMDDEILVSANCALTDFTETNGATRVVPGSHRWKTLREPRPEEVCLAVMPKGSALIYSGNAVHSGGANTDEETRIGLYLGYIVSWLRPIENQLITNDPSDILALPEQAQRLLDVSPGGFTVYA
jgi:ectoine hydroxylase-related dioxygenase (phytanoyl-CoA dioxygenase family)